MYEAIKELCKGRTTGKTGHEIEVDDLSDKGRIDIWYKLWGEYKGEDDLHHMGIAQVKKENGTYSVGWLRDTEQEPYRTDQYSSEQKMLDTLDREIAKL